MKRALKAAFPHTLPVLTGYLFMGAAFGILLQSKGYSALWVLLMSVFVYSGTMQFVSVNLLVAPFAPVNVFLMTLMINARHIFYGFSMLDRLRDFGRKKLYMIFSMTDETFSMLYSLDVPPDIDRKKFSLCIAALDHLYWICGCVSGALLGSAININSRGIEFVMTALFVAIFVDQIREKSNRLPAVIGGGGTMLCLLTLGSESFLIPAMILMVVCLTAVRKRMEMPVNE